MTAAGLDLFGNDWRSVWGNNVSNEPVGAIFTKPEIVRLILDLAGYTSDRPLVEYRLLEPSCGDGAFLEVIVARLLDSLSGEGKQIDWNDLRLDCAVRTFQLTRSKKPGA